MADLLTPRCGCEDCEAAVSPGAYLASLLDYVLKHVRNNGAKIDLSFVEKRFCQPFTELPIDCEAMDKTVHQVRLAVEVLREYLGPRPLLEPAREKALSSSEADYRLAAYTRLLTLLGTTYEEIRRARSAVAADRAALAERLGIDLAPSAAGPRQDELDLLFLDENLPFADGRSLTEQTLERLCGLADTARDRLSEGAKYGDDTTQITRWNVNGAYWNRNTDADGLIYLSILKLAADTYAVHAFSDEARTHAVAIGERKTPSGPIRLVPENGSGLTGVVEIDYQADDTDISVSVIPLIASWRLHHLRTLWRREDWPDAPVSETAEPLPPLIDPQVMSLSDVRNPRPGDVAYDLWLNRYTWLGSERTALKNAQEAAVDRLAGLEAIIAQALSVPDPVTVANLDLLDKAQREGERIETRLTKLGLTPAAFAFLMQILGLARAAQPIADHEWEIVYDTLLFARKRLHFPAWRAAEKDKLTLSPSHFRVGGNVPAPEQATSLSQPFWLSTREVRRGWVEVLEARIAQESAIVAGLADAVSSVEETTLPLIRDVLLDVADVEGNSLSDRAEWLTQRLLLDFRMSGSQRTTRVAQAIETIQELLFSLRTGQLEQDTLSGFAPLESICAVAQDNRRIDLFGRGEDDVLWHRVWDGSWRSWRSLGSLPGAGTSFRPSDVAAVAHSNRLDLVVRGSGRVLWHKRYDDGWSDWLRVTDDLNLVGNLAVTLRSPDQMDVFALRVSDLEVMQRHNDGTSWTPWEATGITSSRTPAAASWAPDRVDLILGRRTPDLFKPLHRWWDGVAWQEEPLDNVLAGDPVAVSDDANRLDFFQNFSGHLWQKSWDGLAWKPWVDLDAALPAFGAAKLRGVPSAYSISSATIDVFALRNGSVEASVWRRRFAAGVWSEWELLPSDHLELDAPDFESEWEWIGSYATFRAAMFVRMYPDNLLHPSLITHQTPAFRTLVEKSRPTKRLTPDQACELARTYSNYLFDVSALEVIATCQVLTDFSQEKPCKTAAPVRKNLLYMFGLTKRGKVYWSAIDPNDRSGFAQSFWAEVPVAPKQESSAPKVVKVIGALPWLDRSVNQHFIYLFLDMNEQGIRKLKCMKFDLDQFGPDGWKGESVELSVSDLPRNNWGLPPLAPPIAVQFLTILPVQSDSVTEPPRLAIHQPSSTFYTFIRPLNATGDGWKEGDWKSFQFEPRYNYPPSLIAEEVNKVEAALRVDSLNWLVYRHGKSLRAYAEVPLQSGATVFTSDALFRGALPGHSTGSSFFLFYDEDGQIVYREFKKGPTSPVAGSTFITSLKSTLARHSGSFQPTFFVAAGTGGHSYAYRCKSSNGELLASSKVDVVPVMAPTTNIPVGESMPALQARRSSIKSIYQKNKGSSASILTYLAEAYRLVPEQLALNMQSSGEYVAALDWFMTVYDYRAPQGERYIDYGLVIDAGLPETVVYKHPEDWLLDPLNPHAVALTRRYAYTRFVIASVIRCLNEFADSEFTYDTDESLVRARLLYSTALELCDVPELRQNVGLCEALIGELKIQPGELVPPAVAAALGEIVEELTLGKVGGSPWALDALERMTTLVKSGKAWATIVPGLTELKTAALRTVPASFKAGAAVSERPAIMAQAYSGLLTDPGIESTAKLAGEIAVAQASAWMDKV